MSHDLFRPEVMQARQAAWLYDARNGPQTHFNAVAGVTCLLPAHLAQRHSPPHAKRTARLQPCRHAHWPTAIG